MIYVAVSAKFDWTFRDYLANRARGIADRFRVIHYEDFPSRTAFERGTYVLAGFARMSPPLRRLVADVDGQLRRAEGMRLLNDPARTMARFELLEALSREKRNDFRAVRAGGDLAGLRYPVFLRSETTHDGALSPLLRTRREIEAAIGRALVRGRRLDDLLVVEFCDTADGDGLYRKYSAFVVGERVLARNLEISRRWVVKDSVREFTRATVDEERDFVFGNPHAEPLAEIFRLAGVQYGRIDYAMKDGRVQTWEINLHPTIGPVPHPTPDQIPPDLRPICEESRRRFYAGFEEAWKAVDLDANGRPPVRVSPAGSPVSGEPPVPGAGRRILRAARRSLSPLRPALEALAAPVFPLIGRVARRVRARRRRGGPGGSDEGADGLVPRGGPARRGHGGARPPS